MTTGTIIGRRRVRSWTNFPAALRTSRSSTSTSRTTDAERLLDRLGDRVARLVEQILGLGGVDPAPRDDLGSDQHLAGLAVDGDDHDDNALGREHLAITQHAVADVADDAIDVEVAGRHAAVHLDPGIGDLEHVAVLAHQHSLVGHAHQFTEATVGHQVAELAVDGHVPLRVARSTGRS